MDNPATNSLTATQATSQSKLWALEARGTNVTEILNRAREILDRAEGITLINEPAYYNGLVFEKNDNIAHAINPKDEQWGYTLEGEEVISLKVVQRNEKKKGKNKGMRNKM